MQASDARKEWKNVALLHQAILGKVGWATWKSLCSSKPVYNSQIVKLQKPRVSNEQTHEPESYVANMVGAQL